MPLISLVVTTDRRTYRMRVKTSRTSLMPYVSFTYPEDAQAKWDAIRTRKPSICVTTHQTGEYLGIWTSTTKSAVLPAETGTCI